MRLDSQKPKPPTRRTFLGCWIGVLLTTAVAAAVAPIAVYIFPPHGPSRGKGRIRVALATPVAQLKEGAATRFDAPAGMAFVMADSGGQNAAGDPTFGGFLTRDQGTLRAFAISCPHLGCSYAFDDCKQHFVSPCHG